MHWTYFQAVVPAIALALVVSSSSGYASDGPKLYSQIDAYVQKLVDQDRVSGLALAVVKDGAITHQRGFGFRCSGESQVNNRTQFVLGSMSKSFTALAIMQLVEARKVDLEAPVQHYISWFQVADEEASYLITVRQLLHHTSGFPKRVPFVAGTATLEEHVRALGAMKLAQSPGKGHLYSSGNYQVLGLIVEQVTGKTFAEYVRQRIFEPLAMNDSRMVPDKSEASLMACGHRYWAGFPFSVDLPHESGRLPTAAIISTAGDLAKYTKALLNQGRGTKGTVLSPAGVRELLKPGVDVGRFGYAMGWRVGPIHKVPAIHHGGIVDHFRGKIIMLPQQNSAVVVLTNVSGHIGRHTSHLIANGVAAILAGKKAPRASGLRLGLLLSGLALVLLVLSIELVKEIVTLGRWTKKLTGEPPKTKWAKIKLWSVLGFGVVFPLVLLFGLPLGMQISWKQLLQAMPDVMYWLLVYLPCGFVLTGTKIRRAWSLTRNTG
jgi:CubicO group peptidase (beta-lactamase class C family)